jgi:hypothetical protein
LTAPFFPNGIPIALGATGGTMAPASAPTQSGSASSTFTAGPPAIATVSATLDNQTVTRSLPLSPVVAAPTVQTLQRLGFRAQPMTFVLTFSTVLEQATAEDVANYRLNPIFGHHLGHAIQIKAAVYDPLAHTVTLQPVHRVLLFGNYRLLVNGSTPTGVTGARGLLLDGKANGQPGSDFVTTFGKKILAGPNAQVSHAKRSPLLGRAQKRHTLRGTL